MKNYNSIQEKIISSWLLKDKLFWTLFPSIFLFDQITKYLVYKNLALGQSIPDDFIIKITYARNTGTAFSLFSSYGSLLLIISIFVAVFFTIYFLMIEKPKLTMRLFISLVVAGALGNIIDRVRFGYVNDFIDVGFWPIFNIADSSISIALTIYFIDLIFLNKKMKINIIAKRIERLDKLISSNTDFSRSEVVEIIEKNCCVVDGKIQNKKSTIISPDSKIEILSVNSTEKKTYKKINTYLVDEDIIVVEKPANMITHRASKNNDVSLCEHIVNSYPEIKSVGDIDRPGIVHRLDKDTSGLMIIARSANAYEKLKEMIKERSISRNYEALVYGKPKLKEAIIDAPIIRDPKNPIKRRVSIGGKESKTSYRIKKNFEEYSLLDVKLFSGRTHQIRVHLEHVGHPVVGDNLYGNKKSKLTRSFFAQFKT